MNSSQRIHLSEEDLTNANSASNERSDSRFALPVLGREAAVVADANSNQSKKSEAQNTSVHSNDIKNVSQKQKSPVAVIVVGMAGSGKSTLMAQLQRSLRAPNTTNSVETHENSENDANGNDVSQDSFSEDKTDEGDENVNETIENKLDSRRVGYCLNLDPATKLMPFAASIDIRDTVDYKEVMLQHQLGPNGAIMTSLNLFASRFDQVIQILEKRSFRTADDDQTNTNNTKNSHNLDPYLDYILIDTPGQIEAFTWSASGTIMTSALASSFPTILAFVVDTPRCASSPSTFMSNMLYACSMMYRTKLPVLIVFNKIDVAPHDFCVDWMTNYETFQEALDGFADSSESGYYGSLTRGLSVMLDEFYSTLNYVGVSAATGDGIQNDFWDGVEKAAREFETGYLADLKGKMEEHKAKKHAEQRQSLNRLKMSDLSLGS